MSNAKPAKSQCFFGSKLPTYDGKALSDPTKYQKVVSALQYCTTTRPKKAFGVNQLCQHMHDPTTAHWVAAQRVLRYLKYSLDHGLLYTKGSLQLLGCYDSDWASSPNDCQSTSGLANFLGTSLISQSSKKQSVVS